ncbi:MAG: hypothetical protein PHS49_03605 [Candidatus Gracilibacteria bacterium]|nr:hypothetical protein [Candidatus Gracilibacteria bacterium]
MIESKNLSKYINIRKKYEELGPKIESILRELLIQNSIEFHYISSRTKTIKSFLNKVNSGKYKNPLVEITDLLGIRIISYVESEIPKICEIIKSNFEIDSLNSLDKSSLLGKNQVGYKSIHYIASLNSARRILPEYKKYEGFKFEIQIRTILQHAWAEIEHDKNYKFSGKLPNEIQRNLYLLSGVLELADKEFNRISLEIDNYSIDIEEKYKKGELDIEINSTSLTSYLNKKFKKLIEEDKIKPEIYLGGEIVEEVLDFGLRTIKEFDKIFPNDYISKCNKYINENINFTGIIRDVLLINDYKKYFEKSFKRNWWIIDNGDEELLKSYNIDIDELFRITNL